VIRRLRSVLKKTPFEIRDIDLNQTVREAMGFVGDLARGQGVALSYVPASTELQVKGDPVQLQQVVLNLIMNAIDAASGADVRSREISVTAVHAGSYAEVRVADTGPGIAPGDLKTVFDPFFSTKPQGMGMGLTIVRSIVGAHQGRISVENQPSGGALFIVRLPIARGGARSA
jgi:signal transduction histidine kinase